MRCIVLALCKGHLAVLRLDIAALHDLHALLLQERIDVINVSWFEDNCLATALAPLKDVVELAKAHTRVSRQPLDLPRVDIKPKAFGRGATREHDGRDPALIRVWLDEQGLASSVEK